MKKIIRIACVSACAAMIGSGCVFNSREVTVSYNNSLSSQREYFRNELISHDGLALESENFLRGNLMQSDLKSNPMMVLKKLGEFYKVSENPKYLIIAADLCRYLATQVNEAEAIQYHLSNYYYCTSFSRIQTKRARENEKKSKEKGIVSNDMMTKGSQSMQNYNEACSGIFSYLKKRNILDATSITLTDKEGRKFVLQKPVFRLSVPREAIESFSLCASYTVKDLMQINREPGIGIPLVAVIKMKQWYSSLKTPKGLTIPVTLIVHRQDVADGVTNLRLIFIDTCKQEVLEDTIGDGTRVKISMALDFSTPLAYFLNNYTQRNLLSQMLNPHKQEKYDGLYMIEPYQPNKIPVVFIHGLMSSPETWMQMINSLKNDPTIRKRYQFWFFSYSTGTPVIFSAKKLRTALWAAQREFCTTPETTANFNKMVLVGHSMGGMLTRQMLVKDPHYMTEQLLRAPWDQIKAKLLPEDFKVVESFAQPPLPFVHRAVFMAAPHRGANMAQSLIARLGVYLIQLPKSVLSKEPVAKRVMKTLHPNVPIAKLGNRFYTGIDNLDPRNPFVLAHGASQMKDDLTYHCIIGNIGMAGAPDASDGVVPYWSSHLDNAASELIVKSDHSVHRRPAAIQELLRILLLHLKAVDTKK